MPVIGWDSLSDLAVLGPVETPVAPAELADGEDLAPGSYVIGISFGAFMVQELLAIQGNVAEGYLIANGRLDMPPEIWMVFAEGGSIGFVDVRDDAGAETSTLHRNLTRLAAGLGHHRYTERLAGLDMSNVVYVTGALDRQVGRLSDAENAFLIERGADVVQYDGGHVAPDAVTGNAFSRIFPPELLK